MVFKKTLGITLVFALILLTGLAVNSQTVSVQADPVKGKVENVIFMIPDGYSSAYATNYRWFKGSTPVMDNYLVGMMKTYSANTKVTDSAAAGTAMATGVKTNNGMISISPEGKNLKTILEASVDRGKSSGLVATSTITHATPAVFASHVASRADEADIAPQLLNKVDVILGGGKQYFTHESKGGKQKERDLLEEAEKDGYQLVNNRDQLMNTQTGKLLGLFSDDAMAPELNRKETQEPSLAEMTDKAIQTLSKNRKGFFLMVEGSQIDWAGHANDAAWAMSDTEAFEKAVKVAIDYAKKDGKTLVVIAGDHDTGGMSVGGYNQYAANPEVLRNVKATGDGMAAKLNTDRSNVKEVIKTYAGIDLKEEEVEKIKKASKPGNAINGVINERALVGWTSGQHTGTDVPLYAYGPGSHLFSGLRDNTDLPKLMAKAMRVELNNN